MPIKIEAETLSAQISTLSSTSEQHVKTVSLQFSNNKTAFVESFQTEIKQLQAAMEEMQSTVKKLSNNAASCKDAVVKLDLQLKTEIGNTMCEEGVLIRED